MTTWLDGIFQNTGVLSGIATELRELSYAFGVTGNKVVADELRNIASELKTVEENIRDIVGKHVHHEYTAAMQSSANLIATALTLGDKSLQETQP